MQWFDRIRPLGNPISHESSATACEKPRLPPARLALIYAANRRWRERRRGCEMPLGLIMGIGRAVMRRKRTSSLGILSSKRAPRDYYKGKNCKSTGFHTRKGGYVVVDEKLPRYVVPDLTDFKLKPYVAQISRNATTTEAANPAK